MFCWSIRGSHITFREALTAQSVHLFLGIQTVKQSLSDGWRVWKHKPVQSPWHWFNPLQMGVSIEQSPVYLLAANGISPTSDHRADNLNRANTRMRASFLWQRLRGVNQRESRVQFLLRLCLATQLETHTLMKTRQRHGGTRSGEDWSGLDAWSPISLSVCSVISTVSSSKLPAPPPLCEKTQAAFKSIKPVWKVHSVKHRHSFLVTFSHLTGPFRFQYAAVFCKLPVPRTHDLSRAKRTLRLQKKRSKAFWN